MLVGTRAFGSDSARQKPAATTKSQVKRSSNTSTRPAALHKPFGWRPANFVPPTPAAQPAPTPSAEPMDKTPTSSTNASRDASKTLKKPSDNSQNTHPPATRTMPRPIAQTSRSRSRASQSDSRHDPSAVSPSVAALLAMTTIPKRKKASGPKKTQPSPTRMTAQELREEWLKMGASLSASNSSISPAMDALLSPPDEEGELFPMAESPDEGESRQQPCRSVSSDSMPSLDRDDNSIRSWTPSTPRSLGSLRNRPDRKEKILSSPESIEDFVYHPLSSQSTVPISSDEPHSPTNGGRRESSPSPGPAFRTRSPGGRLASWKSNLSASLEAVRKAAISFSNFAAPSILPDDHISRGFTGAAPWRSEMRPRQLPDSPTPAMRRYFSPGSTYVPPARDFHMHDSHLDHTDLEAAAYVVDGIDSRHVPPGAVIAMQEYIVNEVQPSSDNQRASFTTEAGKAQEYQQRREPRENNEFLRICVLEMNMRRSGKMEGPLGVGPGRKAWWLPPRTMLPVIEGIEVQVEVLDEGIRKVIPNRWRAIAAEY